MSASSVWLQPLDVPMLALVGVSSALDQPPVKRSRRSARAKARELGGAVASWNTSTIAPVSSRKACGEAKARTPPAGMITSAAALQTPVASRVV